jgi:membrane fusion protein (multidrug efflux system)
MLATAAFSGAGCHPAPVNAQSTPAAAAQAAVSEAASRAATSPHLSTQTARVTRGEVYQVVPAVGSLFARQTTRIASQVNGRVQEVLVDVGDTVKKGQPLITLDPAFFEAETAQRRAALQAANVMVKQSKLKYERMEELWNNGVEPATTQQMRDDARSAYDLALAQAEQARQGLRYAETQQNEATIRAPYDGIITDRLVDPGEQVNSMFITHLLEIQEISTIELLFTMAQEYFAVVREGMPVTFSISGAAGETGKGVIDRVYPAVDQASRSFRCRALVDNADLRLRPGLLVEVGVVLDTVADALVVPRNAIFQTAAGPAVRVRVAEQNFEERPVKTGLSAFDRVQIVEGVQEGDEVLILNAPAGGTS